MKHEDFSGTHLSVEPPPYAMPPYQYRDNEMFTLKLEVDPDYLRALVPEPLAPNTDDILVIYAGYLHVTEPVKISYGEAGLMVPVSLGEREGTYIPVMYLDEIELLTSGREIWGFPKFRGDIEFRSSADSVEARVSSGDTTLMQMQMDFQREGEPIPVYDREHFLLKSIPSVAGGHDLRQINTCRVRNDHRKVIREGTASLTLGSDPKNPLGDIPVRQQISSVYTVGDIILDRGEVIHDYPAIPAARF